MSKKGILNKEVAKEAVDDVLKRDRYTKDLDNEKLPRGDKLNIINSALTDIHLCILGSGRVSSTEAKNFRHFVKKEMEALIKAQSQDGEKAGGMLNSVVWEAYEAYILFKLEKIDDIKKKKAARIQKILDRREKRRG